MSEEQLVEDEIMGGVYRALCRHGYAALTMQDIADECEKSKSLLHYHYDTKEDLLVAFLDQLLAGYEAKLDRQADRPPAERLVDLVARFVFTPADTERVSFHLALLEMRSQGPFNDRIRRQLRRSDDLLCETVADSLRDGIEAGVFEPVDVERTAALVVATLDGARTRQITLGDGDDDSPVADTHSPVADTHSPVADGTYTRVVAEEVLADVVEPLLLEGADRPPLDDALADLED